MIAALLLSLICAPVLAQSSHPFTGHPPQVDLEVVYGPDRGLVGLSRGDITFTRGKTPADQLKPDEIYILAGAKSSNLPSGRALDPWSGQILLAVMAYEREHGKIPPVLDEAALRSIPSYQAWFRHEPGMIEVFRNPLTGQWPRLDAATPSPGDMYIRVLTEIEKVEYSRHLGVWDVWFGKGPGEKLCGPVFYHRIYGWNGPIYESLPYMTCPSK
jgi:hypothetical protein